MSSNPRLLDVVRARIRTKHYSIRTEKSYVHWIRRFVAFHGNQHPRELGADGVERFLSHLAVDRNVSAATQNLALSAILFLYQQVLEIDAFLQLMHHIPRNSYPATHVISRLWGV